MRYTKSITNTAVQRDVGILSHVRNAKYFRDYDINDVEDRELASMITNFLRLYPRPIS